MLIGLGLLQHPEISTARTATDLARRCLLENLELQIRGDLTGRMMRPKPPTVFRCKVNAMSV